MMTLNDINRLKKKIETAEQEKARLEGQAETLTERMETEFGVKTLVAAEAKLDELLKERDKLEAKVAKLSDEIEASFPSGD